MLIMMEGGYQIGEQLDCPVGVVRLCRRLEGVELLLERLGVDLDLVADEYFLVSSSIRSSSNSFSPGLRPVNTIGTSL